LKFLVDMPLSPTLVRWLVEQGYDAVRAADIGLDRSSDNEVIARACARRGAEPDTLSWWQLA
jgi:predicted nuclease of predicted toxin-antitoxin system